MKVFPIIQKTQNNTYATKSNLNKSQNQVAFSAKRLPSGDYSDWFIDLVQRFPNGLQDHIARFRQTATESFLLGRLFAGDTIDKHVATRRNDYANVVNDIRSGHKPVDIGEKHYEADDLRAQYSSEKDYDNRSGREEYEVSSVPDSDLSNGT